MSRLVKKKLIVIVSFKDAPKEVQNKLYENSSDYFKHLCQYHEDLSDASRTMKQMVFSKSYKTFISYNKLTKNVNGFVILKPGKNDVHLEYLCVKTSYAKGLGIGSKLLTMAEKWAKDKGFTTIRGESTQTATQFYRKKGYDTQRQSYSEFVGISKQLGGKKKTTKKIRKHQGINQQTGRLKKGFKYSGKKLKNGLPQIIKV